MCGNQHTLKQPVGQGGNHKGNKKISGDNIAKLMRCSESSAKK